MFGAIVSGRLVQTNFEQVGETQYATVIPEADKVNHIVVFLTGIQPFPDTMGGSVYFSWPDLKRPPSWQLLGFISNSKPSAIFKIANLKNNSDTDLSVTFGAQPISHNAQIGISIEPLLQIQQQTPAESTAPSTINHFVQFSQKMLTHFFNYSSSFAVPPNQMTSMNDTYIPIAALNQWYIHFQNRLQQNPDFWKN